MECSDIHLAPNVIVTHEVMPSAEVIPLGLGAKYFPLVH